MGGIFDKEQKGMRLGKSSLRRTIKGDGGVEKSSHPSEDHAGAIDKKDM